MTSNANVAQAFVNSGEAINTRNLSYDGVDTLRSYYTDVAKRHGAMILVDSRTYSPTTTKQLGPVWSNAANWYICEVPDITATDHNANVAHLQSVVAKLEKKQERARKYDYTDQITTAKRRLENYMSEFGITF